MSIVRHRAFRLFFLVTLGSWLLLRLCQQPAAGHIVLAQSRAAQPHQVHISQTAPVTSTTLLTPVIPTATPPATPTATWTAVWVTPTPVAVDLFAAATLSIKMTADATTTGTATPLPINWKVLTARVLPYVPEPENTATAEALALEATARAVTTGEPVGVVFWTATPRPPATATATPTPTAVPMVVTATFTPEDIFAAATSAAQATVDATTTGTATPLGKGVVLATNTPKPIVVTSTATPENVATAAVMVARETAIAFTTGEPNWALYVTATPTNLPATPTPRPTNTATPLFIPLADLTATPMPGTPAAFPTLLVGKILFLADLDNRGGPEAYAMDSDGTNIVRLTSLEFYQRAHNREAYSADHRYQTVVKKGGAGQRQIFYIDTFYGSEQSMTQFGSGNAWDPRWSPTADVVIFVADESANDEIWLVHKGQWPAIKLTQNQWEWDKHPSWSPDGTQIIFMSNRTGRRQLWLMAADGSNQRQLTNFDFEAWDPIWVKYNDD